MESEHIQITIDGIEIKVPKGTTVYKAAESMGKEIPIFCYHDRMPPFGACRMCLIQVEGIPKLQASCVLEAREGMKVWTNSAEAKKGQERILELLLINHPLDCPICDKGGECPLQDQTLKYGPGLSRFFETKRQFLKPLPLGPVLMLDRERCIQCARCTRFGELIAGDHALEFIDRGYRMEVGTHDGGPAESKFIGNTIKICPVGALTSQVYRFRARPWDNVSVESTCTLCPVGCSMIMDSRDGQIMRTRSPENRDVNDIWLCDKGWFGYQHVESPHRLTTPLVRVNGSFKPISYEEAFTIIVDRLRDALPSTKAAAFGGNPLTFEENYLFQSLLRALGVSHIDHRIGEPLFSLDEEGMAGGMESSIGSLESLEFASLIGCDLTEEFPLLWLRLKQAHNKGAPLSFIGHFAPEIHSYLNEIILHPPGEELTHLKTHLESLSKLKGKGALLVGSQYLHTQERSRIIDALIRFKESHPHINLHLLDGNEGSKGAREAGMHPELGPFGRRLENPGLDALSVLKMASQTGWEFLWVAGADPARKFSQNLFSKARSKLTFLVVQDLFMTETAQLADLVLPTFSFIEKEGSFINIEGRVQELQPGKNLPEGVLSDRVIFHSISKHFNLDLEGHKKPDQFPLRPHTTRQSAEKPLQTKAGLKATFATSLFDEGVRMKENACLSGMIRGPFIRMHPDDIATLGLSDGKFVIVQNAHGSVKGVLKSYAKMAKGTVVLPLGFSSIPVENLEMNRINGFVVDVRGDT